MKEISKIFLIFCLVIWLNSYSILALSTQYADSRFIIIEDNLKISRDVKNIELIRTVSVDNPHEYPIYLKENVQMLGDEVINRFASSESLTNNYTFIPNYNEFEYESDKFYLESVYINPNYEDKGNLLFERLDQRYSFNLRNSMQDIVFPFSKKVLKLRSYTFLTTQRGLDPLDILPPDRILYGGRETGIDIEGSLFVLDNAVIKIYDLRKFIPQSLGIDESSIQELIDKGDLPDIIHPIFNESIIERQGTSFSSFKQKEFTSNNTFLVGPLELEITLKKNVLFIFLSLFFLASYFVITLLMLRLTEIQKMGLLDFIRSYIKHTGAFFISWLAITIIWASDSFYIMLNVFLYYLMAGFILGFFYIKNSIIQKFKKKEILS